VRISELAARSGVPVSTVKFYLREGLIAPGERSAPNQARYDASHLERLALIRALREVAGLGIETVREVLVQLDRGWRDGDPVGAALRAASAAPPGSAEAVDSQALAAARREVRGFLEALPWALPGHEGHLYVDVIATALVQIRRYLFPGYPVEALGPMARVAWLLSEVEFGNSPGGARVPKHGDDLVDPTRRAVLGTILFERVFAALRRGANAMRSSRITEGLPLPPADVPLADRGPAER
jgi:DNA-binding transcriptional MerR regulator